MDLFRSEAGTVEIQRQSALDQGRDVSAGQREQRLVGQPVSGFGGTAAAAWKCRRSCPTSAAWPTICVWCVRCTPAHNNHTESLIMFMTGRLFQGRPTFGSWLGYGLGTENRNLPAYVVLRDPAGYNTSGTLTWSSGWLPSLYRGTEFSSQGAAVFEPATGPEAAGRCAARQPRFSGAAESHSSAKISPSERFGNAHSELRTGRAHAIGRFAGARSLRRDAADAQALRARQSGHSEIRPAVPLGPQTCRSGGAVRADSPQAVSALGHAQPTPRAACRISAATPIYRPPVC